MKKEIRFEWNYRYVPEGQLEPDKIGRWAIDCYMFVKINKAFPEYKAFLSKYKGYLHIRVATIKQKTIDGAKVFYCITPTFEESPNTGMSNDYHFYGDTIEELKEKIENNFKNMALVFSNTLKK